MSQFAGPTTPGGSVNGTNTIFTLTNTAPAITSFEFYRGGQLLTPPNDYTFTLSGIVAGTSTATVTMILPPQTGDILIGWLWQQ
jgi:hypothetical protein